MASVLVVDDNEDIRLLMRIVLSAAGLDVIEAPGGSEAVDLLATSSELPDAVVLDIQMPDWDGWWTLEEIRAQAATAELPVVMCTVKARDVDRERAFRMGCSAYLVKPFDPRELVRVVELAIGGRLTEGPSLGVSPQTR